MLIAMSGRVMSCQSMSLRIMTVRSGCGSSSKASSASQIYLGTKNVRKGMGLLYSYIFYLDSDLIFFYDWSH
jgi:hypothetical protein